ncbi:ATP-binding region, ATPase domain protein [metagenome]|uniref:histidine kinase n=1 Tax=metagenome TaxID=256318 RepID=A0A2P2CAB7_9ZZZZ
MKSLTSRLVVTAVLLVAVVTLMIGIATTIAMRSNLTDRLDRDVQASMERFTGRPDGPYRPPPDDDGDGDGDDRFADRQQPGTLSAILGGAAADTGFVITSDDRKFLSSEALADLGDVPVDGKVHEVSLPGVGEYRVTTLETSLGTLITGLPTSSVDDTISSMIWAEALLGLLGVGMAGVAGTFVVRRQLAPLREVAATAHEVAALPLESGEVDLSARVPNPDEKTEVGQVGAALNTLLAHVESSLTARHESEQQVRQFVADASHELRTPLSTIRGYAELSRRTPGDAATLSASMTKVETEADRMTSLVDDLLLLARIDSGRPLANEPVDLTRLLLEAVGDARVLGPEHHWRLELPDEPVELLGDEQRLHQVVTNLLTNARRHTPPGTTVTVSARQVDHPQAGGVELVVADDGPGFPPELARTAFERFTRGDAARTRTAGGAGLGLSIVAAIVRAHRGTVQLTSEPGDTRITVRFPGVSPARPQD